MRKGPVYVLLLAAALLLPAESAELGKMIPVEAVSICQDGELLVIETDTGDKGTGMTMEEALADLQKTAAGRIYLDTAQYLLFEERASDQVLRFAGILKDSVRICQRKGEVDMQAVGEYLGQHTPNLKLKNWKEDATVQILESEEGRMKLT